jgi:hypothetical protein
MDTYLIILLAVVLILIFVIILSPKGCKHEEQTYYDAAGDELAGDQSEACFSKCDQCGKIFVIPSGFQSDTHFENYLHETEMGGSSAVKKIGKEK